MAATATGGVGGGERGKGGTFIVGERRPGAGEVGPEAFAPGAFSEREGDFSFSRLC